MLELGNQYIMEKDLPEKTGKEYYVNRGVWHTSVDLCGEDGSIAFDLTTPIPQDWKSMFDYVTNSGTTEHVEPLEGQYQCWKNIHDALKVGGVSIHLIPSTESLDLIGAWKGHCHFYYASKFVGMLARENDYKILSLTRINNLTCFALQKKSDNEFMKDKAKFLSFIDVR